MNNEQKSRQEIKKMTMQIFISLWIFAGLVGGLLLYFIIGSTATIIIWALAFKVANPPTWFHFVVYFALMALVMFIIWLKWRKVTSAPQP